MSKSKWFQWNSADGFLLLTALLWGINIPVVKQATLHVDAMGFNAMRMILSTVTLGVCWWIEATYQKRRLGAKTSPSTPSPTDSPRASLGISLIPRILLFSLFSGLLYPLAFMVGIHQTTAGNTALILASMPMWTALLSKFVLAERLNRLTWLGLGITFVGTIFIIQAKGEIDLSPKLLAGNLFILAGAIIWASATVTSAPLLKQISPLKLAFISAALTTPLHVGFNWSTITSPSFEWQDPTVLACIIYSGILSTGLAYATWNIGVRKLGGSHAAVYQNVVTLVAVVASWVWLQEPVLAMQLLGGMIAIGGLFLIRKGRAHR